MALRAPIGWMLSACLAAMPASLAQASSGDAPSTDRLAIEVTAAVAERCGVSPDRIPLSSVDLGRNETLNFDFQIDCNTPFAIGVSSSHGALRLTTAGGSMGAVDEAGFAVERSYDVALAVQTDSGLVDAGTCSSRRLTAGGNCPFYGAVPGEGISSDGRTAANRHGALTVTWLAGAAGGPRLAAGTYQDMITVVVGPRL